jgi:hypothetical protein
MRAAGDAPGGTAKTLLWKKAEPTDSCHITVICAARLSMLGAPRNVPLRIST